MLTEEELSQALPIFEKLGKRVREMLTSSAKKQTFKQNDVLPRADEIGYFAVRRGHVNVFSEGESGGEFFLYRISKDDGCVVSGSLKYEFGVPSEVILFSQDDCKLIAASAGGGAFLLNKAVAQEESAVAQFNMIMFSGVEKRLANTLLATSAKTRSHTIYLTHEQLARFIGTGREVVTRKIAELSEEGVLETGRGKIVIKDKEALKKKR